VVAVAPAAWGAVAFAGAAGEHPLLGHNHPGDWDRLLAQLSALHLPARTLDVGQVDVTLRMVAEGLGCSFLPRSAVAAELAAGRLRALPLPAGLRPPQVGTWALWPAGQTPGPAGTELLRLLGAPAGRGRPRA
jgi:LysR family transcriptional repressor of citA